VPADADTPFELFPSFVDSKSIRGLVKDKFHVVSKIILDISRDGDTGTDEYA
jgi:hypothetical protein